MSIKVAKKLMKKVQMSFVYKEKKMINRKIARDPQKFNLFNCT
jgi:hypothetical protein